jgi:hypothetical protein
MGRFLFHVLALICLASLGCGGTSTGAHVTGQCDSFTPCGGSIVGTWRLTGTCYSIPGVGTTNADAGTASCLGEQTTTNNQLTGTLLFETNGTYSVATVTSGNTQFSYPASCLTTYGMTCAALNSTLATEGETDAGVSGSCSSTSAGGCTCTETMKGYSFSETGTYTTSGSALTMNPSTSTSSPVPIEYCVQGTHLSIYTTSSSSITATM